VLERETLNGLLLALALMGTAILVAELVLHRRDAPRGLRRACDAALAAVGLACALAWLGPLWLSDGDTTTDEPLHGVHLHDAFHYYMGPKYFGELGYTELYACSAAAEVALGDGAAVARRVYRDLATNRPILGRRLVTDARKCRERFSQTRWKTFVHDVNWFRQRLPFWETVTQDWGYNATPVWNAAGAWAIGSGPVTDRQIVWLTRLDRWLLLAAAALVAWAFGWRTLAVVSIYWGTNVASAHGWTGGSILRHQWLFASVAGLCLLRRSLPVAAGAALTWAALLRIFPGFLVVGIGLKGVAEWVAQRRVALAPPHLRMLIGAALALPLLIAVAVPSGGTWTAWQSFVENSRIDSEPAPNNVGLPTLLGYSRTERFRTVSLVDEGAAADAWMEARRERLARRRPLQAIGIAGFLWLAIGAVRRHPDWIAALVGLGLVVFAFDLSCYYYAFLLMFGFLWPRHRSVGIALCALAAASLWIRESWPDDEDLFAAFSLLAVLFVTATTALLRFTRSESGTA